MVNNAVFVKENILKDKSYKFALRIVSLYKYLMSEKKEFVLSKQVLRSGTAIGALVREAEFAQSKFDFVSKMSIALKEASETDYWLNIFKDTKYLTKKEFESMSVECCELLKLLIAIIRTAKSKVGK